MNPTIEGQYKLMNPNTPTSPISVYNKNEKDYTCFCYKNPFSPVINREMKNIFIGYQVVNFSRFCFYPLF